MQPVLNMAISAARQASDIILRYQEIIERVQVHQKGPKDYFSEVDVKAEQAIMRVLSKAYPSHGFVAEESGVHQPDAEHVWYIDPLDGTNNYLHGFPFFCVSIALKVQDKIECAVVYDPIRHECFSAIRGGGAKLNDRRLRMPSRVQSLENVLLGTTYSFRTESPSPYHASFVEVANQIAGFRKSGAAALELAYVAAGRTDAFAGVNLKPWDIAAGSLLIQEAGGLISDLDGLPDYLNQGHLIATNPKVYKPLFSLF